MPVWLGIDGAYVAGSWSAYAALALEKFQEVAAGLEQERWAGAMVNASGICRRLGLDPPWARRAKGLVYAATGHRDWALIELRRASRELAAVDAPDALGEAEIGHLLLLDQKFDQALGYLRKAVELDPDKARSWSDLGLVLVHGGDQEGAERAFSRALELDPRLATAWYNRGLLNMHKGDLAKAAADLSRAAKFAPENQDIAHLLQRIELARKQQQEP